MKKKIYDPNELFHKDEITGENADDFSFDLPILKKCLNNLASKHGSTIIYGDRGVGKSSLAWQLLSILTDDNSKFDKESLLYTGIDLKFKCIFFTCNSQINDFYELLLAILRPASYIYSLSKVIPKLYSEKYQTEFRLKYKFDLYGLNFEIGTDKEKQKSPKINLEDTYKSFTSKQTVINLFNDVIDDVIAIDPQIQLIFFIDEVNLIKNKDGLGEFLKTSKHCKFVFIGVFEDVLDILSDNFSAGRNLTGGDIKIEPLNNDRVKWIFKNAEINSNGGIKFSDEFVSKAIKYSNGIPWIIQNLGFHSIDKKLLTTDTNEGEIFISTEDFEPALNEVISLYRKEHENKIDFGAKKSLTEMKILNYLWESTSPVEDIDIINFLKNNGRYVTSGLKDLKKSGLIIQNKNKKYQYLDPTVRILVRYLLDNA